MYFQLKKYLPKYSNVKDNYLNPLEKKFVVVFKDLGNYSLNQPLLKELQDAGVIFINGIENIKKLY